MESTAIQLEGPQARKAATWEVEAGSAAPLLRPELYPQAPPPQPWAVKFAGAFLG